MFDEMGRLATHVERFGSGLTWVAHRQGCEFCSGVLRARGLRAPRTWRQALDEISRVRALTGLPVADGR